MKHDLEKIPFGNSSGKTFMEVTLTELDRIAGWLEQKNMHKGWKYGTLYNNILEYLKLNHFGPGMDHDEHEENEDGKDHPGC